MIGLPFSGLNARSPTALALPHAEVRPACDKEDRA
jgi:hypothetical protein